ncbi:hypothetical protein ACH4E8_17105 [Streptomyces sp. NPDC017979]|uniref:hypothetical protein n=1 Tax=Streptomyces sp. NPDC017979 TaxID=3365024 RepID=UPI0037B1F864
MTNPPRPRPAPPGSPPAELVAREPFPGFGDRHGRYDAWLARQGATWLVSETGADLDIVVGKVSRDPSRVFEEVRTWPSLRRGFDHGFASPLADGGLAVTGAGAVTVYGADGTIRWRYEHEPWGDEDRYGACVPDGSGRLLLVTTPDPSAPPLSYDGDLCVALDLSDGRPVLQAKLPSAGAGYVFQQSLTDPSHITLNAAQGDTFYAFTISVDDGSLGWEAAGVDDELFAGPPTSDATLMLHVGGQWLSRYNVDGTEATADAEAVLPEGMQFVGFHPGFLDKDHVLAAIAEENWAPASRHLLLDARTLVPVAEVDYPGTTFLDPLPLGDGTWLTVHDDIVHRWRTTV